jgi:hypothetical protein
MKAITTTLASLFMLSAHAAVFDRRQDASLLGLDKLPKGFDVGSFAKSLPKGGLTGFFNPEVRMAFKVEQIAPKRMPDAKRVRLTYGPYKLKAATVGSFFPSSFHLYLFPFCSAHSL